ncbi:MAG: hypothetical protein J3R72DRAFT_425101 [Linnemannia gamsii]|nr:MAG: hypothetical protein J3R72DRAFT_425101 [Linnemannia gamsii]
MAADRSRSSSSSKSILINRATRRPVGPRRELSFHDEHSPAFSTIRSPPNRLATEEPLTESDAASADEANTSFVTQHPIEIPESVNEENSIPSPSAESIPHIPEPTDEENSAQPPLADGIPQTMEQEQEPHLLVQDILPGPANPAEVGGILARLEIRWNETYQEMNEAARKANDLSLPLEQLEWYRHYYANLQGQEHSLRDDIRRLTPMAPPPTDPNMQAYLEVLAAYGETLRAYLTRPPHH